MSQRQDDQQWIRNRVEINMTIIANESYHFLQGHVSRPATAILPIFSYIIIHNQFMEPEHMQSEKH